MPATSVTTTMDNLNAVTNRHFVSTIIKDAWLIDAPTLRLLYDERKILSGGTVLSQPVRYDRNDFQFYSAHERFRTTQIQTKTEARQEWKLVGVPIQIDEYTINRNGDESIVDLAEQTLTEGKEDLINGMAYWLWRTPLSLTSPIALTNLGGNIYFESSDNAWNGIRYAIRSNINSSTHTYENIPNSNSWWRAQVSAGTGATDDWGTTGTARELTLDLIRARLSAINKGRSRVGYCAMDDDAFDKFEALVFPQKRFMSEQADLGFDHIVWRGCVFYPDPYLTENKNPSTHSSMYFFNTDMFFMVIHKNKDMAWSGWQRPEDQEAYTGQITCMGNYFTINRLRMGSLLNLTP